MLTINGVQVSQSLHEDALSMRRRGSKVFLALEDSESEDPTSPACPHCHGSGFQYLQQVTGGPYDVATGGKGATMINEGGRWYAVKTAAYNCPLCRREISL